MLATSALPIRLRSPRPAFRLEAAIVLLERLVPNAAPLFYELRYVASAAQKPSAAEFSPPRFRRFYAAARPIFREDAVALASGRVFMRASGRSFAV